MYKCIHFAPYELVPPEVYEELKGDQEWRLWAQFDERGLRGLDLLWEHLNKLRGSKVSIIINNYYWGGRLTRCGLRPPPRLDGESKWGQHPRGGAWDVHTMAFSPEQVRQEILRNKAKFAPFFRQIERDTPTWVHLGCGNYIQHPDLGEIYLINPV